MHKYKCFTAAALLTSTLLLVINISWHLDHHHSAKANSCSLSANTSLLLQQRDQISRQLNILQERHQQLICRTMNQSTTSETGGWCGVAVQTEHATDPHLADGLAQLFCGGTVIGMGDGLGVYRKLILSTGKVKTYDAYDGAPNIHKITGGKVKFLDLTLPQYWLPRYDWVLSMEVLEHIPAEFESIALDNIDRAAGRGVVLSWGIPGQKGFYHINNRPPTYVNQTMLGRGFKLDREATLALISNARAHWLKRNVKVYIRK